MGYCYRCNSPGTISQGQRITPGARQTQSYFHIPKTRTTAIEGCGGGPAKRYVYVSLVSSKRNACFHPSSDFGLSPGIFLPPGHPRPMDTAQAISLVTSLGISLVISLGISLLASYDTPVHITTNRRDPISAGLPGQTGRRNPRRSVAWSPCNPAPHHRRPLLAHPPKSAHFTNALTA